MAEVIWGLATSHVPSIGAAMDRRKTEDPYWKPLFDGYAPARAWMARHTPDVAVVVYNDHANAVDLSVTPTFAIGAAAAYDVADEGWGSRPVPPVVGAPGSPTTSSRAWSTRPSTSPSTRNSTSTTAWPGCLRGQSRAGAAEFRWTGMLW